jgi:hypothetical protein
LVVRGFLPLFALVAGCGAMGAAHESALDGTPIGGTTTGSPGPITVNGTTLLAFNADWTITQSGQLKPGKPAIVRYDLARLPSCRAQYNGGDAWNIQASYSGDGEQAINFAVTSGGFKLTPKDVTFTVPYAHDLAFWFLNTDDAGCVAWDSDYGRNFHFAVEPPPEATIHFRRQNWAISVEGTITAGEPLTLDYDLTRLPSCRQDYNGLPTWEVLADYRFDGGDVLQAPVTSTPSDYERVQAPAHLEVPPDAHSIEVWFESHDRTGCQAWDSDYGQNFHFDVK